MLLIGVSIAIVFLNMYAIVLESSSTDSAESDNLEIHGIVNASILKVEDRTVSVREDLVVMQQVGQIQIQRSSLQEEFEEAQS